MVHVPNGEVCDSCRDGFGVRFFFGFGRSGHRSVRQASLASAAKFGRFSRSICQRFFSGPYKLLDQCRDHFAPIGLAIVLCLGLVFEFEVNIGNAANNSRSAAPGLQNGSDAQTAPASFPTDGEIKTWVAAALARPLFSPDRSAVAVAALTAPSLPRLMGTMISPVAKIGIFGSTNGGTIIVKEGDHLGVFEVLSVAADGVHVNGPAGVITLRIHDDMTQVARIIKNSETAAANTEGFSEFNLWPSQLQAAAP